MAYPDGRPQAGRRIPAQDHGIVLRHGALTEDGYGIREPLVFQHDGTYYLHYDGSDEETGWSCYLATSADLVHWSKQGRILAPAQKPGEQNGDYDSGGAVYNYPFYENGVWHGFYIGSNFAWTTRHEVCGFPYITLKATSPSPRGPWTKQPVRPFFMKPGTYYETTASSGAVVKAGDEYLQFFSASVHDKAAGTILRTLGLARTRDLDGEWSVDREPLFPLDEQVENSALFYQEETATWFLFTNHVGLEEGLPEYTDALWMYWSRDVRAWRREDKAVVLDGSSCSWSKRVVGAPSVIRRGDTLHVFYDGQEDGGISHYHRQIGMATMPLPLIVPSGAARL
jgi:predicted GH43/DUF377 family glycosyl hydrolase